MTSSLGTAFLRADLWDLSTKMFGVQGPCDETGLSHLLFENKRNPALAAGFSMSASGRLQPLTL